MNMRSVRRGMLLAAAALVLPVAVAACGDDDDENGSEGGGLTVVASTTIVADWVKNVGGGHVSVSSIVPMNTDVHSYIIVPSDIRRIGEADIVFMIGEHLESGFEGEITSNASGPIVELAEGLSLLPFPETHAHDDHDDEGDHDHDAHDDEGHEDDHHDEDGPSVDTFHACVHFDDDAESHNAGGSAGEGATLEGVHTLFEVQLAGGEGYVQYEFAEARTYAVFASSDVEITLTDSSGSTVPHVADSHDVDDCDAIGKWVAYEIPAAGTYELFIEGAENDEVLLVVETATGHGHDHEDGDDHEHDEDDDHDHEDDGHDHDEDDEHSHEDDDHGHAHGEFDPHIFMDIDLTIAAVERIRDSLIELDADNADDYRANTEAYVAQLRELDDEIRDMLSELPENRRYLVTFHDAYGYFAARYGLELLGFVVENPDEQPSASRIAELVDEIRARDVEFIYAEPQFNAQVLEQIANDTGAQVRRIPSDALSDEVPDYISLMRAVAEGIAN